MQPQITEIWCNGSTRDSGSLGSGSSPDISTLFLSIICAPIGFTNSHVFSKDGGSIIFKGKHDTPYWVFYSLVIDGKYIPLFKEDQSVK